MRLLLILVLLAGPAMGQTRADTVVVRVEYSRAGEYARKGAIYGGAAGVVGWGAWASIQKGQNPYGEQKPQHAARYLPLAAGIGLGLGAILGATIGSGERWTEEHQETARVSLVPLRDGVIVALSLSWP